MQKNTLVIKSIVEAISPISIAQHGDRNKNKVPFAIVNGQKHACIPGSSLRGALRHPGSDLLLQTLKQQNGDKTPWTLEDLYWNSIGGVKLSKEDAGNDFKDISKFVPFTLVENIRARNPFISLFGTFDPCAVTGRLQVGNAVCESPINSAEMDGSRTVNLDQRFGVRSDPLQRNPEIAQVLDPASLDEWAENTAGARQAAALRSEIKDLNAQARKSKKNGDDPKALYEKIKKLEAQRDALIKESANSSVSVQQLIDPSEFIPAGSVMNQRLRVIGASDVETGLLFAVFKHYANNCMVGGKHNIGNGEIKTTWAIRDVLIGKTVAEIRASLDDGFEILSGEEYIKNKLAAWEDFVLSGALKTIYPTTAEMKVSI